MEDPVLIALSKTLSNCERSQLPQSTLLGGPNKRLTKNLKGKIGNKMSMGHSEELSDTPENLEGGEYMQGCACMCETVHT